MGTRPQQNGERFVQGNTYGNQRPQPVLPHPSHTSRSFSQSGWKNPEIGNFVYKQENFPPLQSDQDIKINQNADAIKNIQSCLDQLVKNSVPRQNIDRMANEVSDHWEHKPPLSQTPINVLPGNQQQFSSGPKNFQGQKFFQ